MQPSARARRRRGFSLVQVLEAGLVRVDTRDDLSDCAEGLVLVSPQRLAESDIPAFEPGALDRNNEQRSLISDETDQLVH